MTTHIRQRHPRAAWIAALGIALAAFSASAQINRSINQQALPRYTVTDLGTLGGTYSLAGGLSSSGWVEGKSTLTGDTALHPVLWRGGMMNDLGTLGGPNADAGYRPNDSGDVGGASETGASDPFAEDFCGYGDNLVCLPIVWWNDIKKMTPLPTLGGNNGWAAGINDQNEVAGVAENTTQEPTCAGTSQVFQFKPVIWTKGQVHELGTFAGDPVGMAWGINEWGQATGYSGNCTTVFHALLWQYGRVINLGDLGGTMNNEGLDINNLGQVVGYSDLPGDATGHGFLWQKRTGMIDLGTLPGDVGSDADGINNPGQVVGGSWDAEGNDRAYLWQNGVMTDLNTLIPADSPLYLIEATGTINDRGQIAGIAMVNSTGDVHAFLATPTKETWPVRESQKVVLPENVRNLLQRRLRFGGRLGFAVPGSRSLFR
jgi:probable HAF family extracellular repeat protein